METHQNARKLHEPRIRDVDQSEASLPDSVENYGCMKGAPAGN